MKTASAKEVQAKFSAFLKTAQKEPVVVTRNSRPIAIILSMDDPDEIERIAMRRSKKLRKTLEASSRQIEAGKGIPHDEFWRQIEKMRKG